MDDSGIYGCEYLTTVRNPSRLSFENDVDARQPLVREGEQLEMKRELSLKCTSSGIYISDILQKTGPNDAKFSAVAKNRLLDFFLKFSIRLEDESVLTEAFYDQNSQKYYKYAFEDENVKKLKF